LGREAVDALRRFIEQADSLGVLVTTSGVGGKGLYGSGSTLTFAVSFQRATRSAPTDVMARTSGATT